MKLQQMIEKAAEKVTNSKEGTPERAAAEAELAALKGVGEAEDYFTQDQVNGFVAKEKQGVTATKDRIEKMFGTDLESVEGVLSQFETMLTDDNSGTGSGTGEGSGTGTGAGTGEGQGGSGNVDANGVLNRMLGELKKRDDTISTLQQGTQNFQRSYFQKGIEDDLAERFRNMGLEKDFEGAAKNYLENVVGISDLVDKRMKGENPTEEEVKAKLDAVQTALPVIFQPVPNPDLPEIPVTPDGQPPRTLTDQEREQASVASGGQVF